MDAHDEVVNEVSTRREQLFQAIKESSHLLDVYLNAISSQSLQEIKAKYPQDIRYGETDEDILRSLFNFPDNQDGHLATFAEDIMNQVGETHPHSRTTAPLWNTYREQFLEVLNYPPVSDYWAQTDAAREELLRRIETLITLLKKKRSELTKQHGVPVEKTADVHYVYRDYGFS